LLVFASFCAYGQEHRRDNEVVIEPGLVQWDLLKETYTVCFSDPNVVLNVDQYGAVCIVISKPAVEALSQVCEVVVGTPGSIQYITCGE